MVPYEHLHELTLYVAKKKVCLNHMLKMTLSSIQAFLYAGVHLTEYIW
jgi:hypothetical protein